MNKSDEFSAAIRRQNEELYRVAKNKNHKANEGLLQAGADPNAKDKANKTPWDYAKDNEALKNSERYWRRKDRR